MLAKAEKDYLNGKFTGTPDYKRKLHERIRKKTHKAMNEMTLILEHLPNEQLKKIFTEDVYYDLVVPFSRILYKKLEPLFGYETNRIRNLQDILEAGGIPYNHRRLWLDRNYQLRMSEKAAEWMRENWRQFLGLEMPEWKRQRLKEFLIDLKTEEVQHSL